MYLSLSRPEAARRNADNYNVFAVCMRFEELDCLDTFQDQIQKRGALPFEVDRRTVKIRGGEVDLTAM